MKKIISFDKNLEFNSMIGNICSISFDHTLEFKDSSNISGEFLISGSYKLTEASRLEEKFEFKIPVDIMLNETINVDSSDIQVEDFSYKLQDDDTLVCHIEIKIEGLEEVIVEEENSNNFFQNDDSLSLIEDINDNQDVVLDRECDGDPKDDVKVDMVIDNDNDDLESINENNSVGSLFSSFKDSDETFSTYSIYIIRNDATIEDILNKYKISKEELENYNDLTNLSIGSKLIIPSSNAEK